jgi:5,10-methylenetetrahydrofolate reductase
LTLKEALGSRPVIYEIVPPRANPSRFGMELHGVEGVMHDRRIDAINIPELINRRESGGNVHYSPATIPPEEYALFVREYKEPIVNMIAPRLTREAFRNRVDRALEEYGVKDIILVGRERREDVLPGPSVVEALDLVREGRHNLGAVGGICIFTRKAGNAGEYSEYGPRLDEPRRMWAKGSKGCDFLTSQVIFDAQPAVRCLVSYQDLCEKTQVAPMTVFLSIATVPTQSILALLERLDVVVPTVVRRRLLKARNMGRESLKIAADVLTQMIESLERKMVRVPLGLQVEQLGVKSEELSLELLDMVYGDFKRA